MIENPPSNAGDMGSIPGQEARIPRAVGQLSPSATVKSPCAAAETHWSQIIKNEPTYVNNDMKCKRFLRSNEKQDPIFAAYKKYILNIKIHIG